jgi:hypothetical protein
MRKQIGAELLKLKKSFGFWALLFSLSGAGVVLAFIFLSAPEPLSGLDAFNRGVMAVEIHIFAIAVFAAIFICGEFENGTIGTSIFCGRGRGSVLAAKVLVYFIGTAILTMGFLAALTLAVTVKNGFGLELTADTAAYLLRTYALYLLGRLALAGFCALLAYTVRNVIGTIGAGIGLSIALLFLAVQGPQDIVKFTFMWQLCKILLLNDPQDLLLSVSVTAANTALLLLAAYFLFRKTDLK